MVTPGKGQLPPQAAPPSTPSCILAWGWQPTDCCVFQCFLSHSFSFFLKQRNVSLKGSLSFPPAPWPLATSQEPEMCQRAPGPCTRGLCLMAPRAWHWSDCSPICPWGPSLGSSFCRGAVRGYLQGLLGPGLHSVHLQS
jgi:hypothetical protein